MSICDHGQISIICIRIIGWFVSDLGFSCDQSFLDFFPCVVDFLAIHFHWKDLTGCFPVVFCTQCQCFCHFPIRQQMDRYRFWTDTLFVTLIVPYLFDFLLYCIWCMSVCNNDVLCCSTIVICRFVCFIGINVSSFGISR